MDIYFYKYNPEKIKTEPQPGCIAFSTAAQSPVF